MLTLSTEPPSIISHPLLLHCPFVLFSLAHSGVQYAASVRVCIHFRRPEPVWETRKTDSQTCSNAKAKSAGLRLRPLSESARDTWAWLNDLEQDEKKLLKDGVGMSREDEKELLRLWHAREGAAK